MAFFRLGGRVNTAARVSVDDMLGSAENPGLVVAQEPHDVTELSFEAAESGTGVSDTGVNSPWGRSPPRLADRRAER